MSGVLQFGLGGCRSSRAPLDGSNEEAHDSVQGGYMSIVELWRANTCDRIFRASEWVIGPQENLWAWEAEGKIFGVDHNGVRHYATYQFMRDGSPLPIIKQILLRLENADPWAIAAWFEYPNSWISESGVAVLPKNALDREDLVLQAALRARESYVA